MPREKSDAVYLWDMLDAAKAIADFVRDKTYQNYIIDRMLQGAVERHIEIIGEAAGHVSQGFRDAHSEIPWRGIIAQRNVIAHEYGEIKHDRIWIVAKEFIPQLIDNLEPLISKELDTM